MAEIKDDVPTLIDIVRTGKGDIIRAQAAVHLHDNALKGDAEKVILAANPDLIRAVAVCLQTGTRIEQAAAAGVLALLCEVVEERHSIATSKVVQPCMQILHDGTPTGRLAASNALMNLALTVESRLKFMKEVEYSYDLLIRTIENGTVAEGTLRQNCATILQAFCATTSGEEGLQARVSLGKGGGIEACVQLMVDGPDQARIASAGVLQYLAQVEELKSRFMTAGAVKPLLDFTERESVDMWGRAYAAGALCWLSMTHEIMRPLAADDATCRKGNGGVSSVHQGHDGNASSFSMAGMSLSELAPKARFCALQKAPMDTAQECALEEMKRRTKTLIEADCAKTMCRLLMPPKAEDGKVTAKPGGSKKKGALREPDVETAHTHATGALRHLMLDPVGMQHVLDMNGVTHVTPLLESPNAHLRANAHAILSLTSLETSFVKAMIRARAPGFYTNLLEMPKPKPAAPEVDPLAFTQRPVSSSGRVDIL